MTVTSSAPPPDAIGLAAWYGIADRYEPWLDHQPAANQPTGQLLGEPTHPILRRRPPAAQQPWDELRFLLDHATDVIDTSRQRVRLDRTPTVDVATCRQIVVAAADAIVHSTTAAIDRDPLELSL